MIATVHYDELVVFAILFLAVTVIGFGAARWRRADLNDLDQWGLAGRGFGSLVTWFLLGGDLYTAYTFIAVPALVFGTGAIGLFAIPYTIIVYPLVYVVMPRLWQVARNRGFVTASDFVRERFDSRLLALLVAITGIVATMPYIALQMFGIQVVISEMGIPVEASLIIAFVVLALFTYYSGLRAPALIAIVKDTLIWVTVIVAVIYIPTHLGGYGQVFHAVPARLQNLKPAQEGAYATLALGSAMALFLYPHAITGVFASSSQRVVKRNAAFLPAYSFLLGLIALLGYMAIAAGIHKSRAYGANSAVPDLLVKLFPGWFAGFAFAAIAIGALVPAAVMSIAAANLFTRNIYREYIRRQATPREETTVAKIVSLVVKVGALAFILTLSTTDVINFQLAGGVWILQTFPAVFLGLYFAWMNRSALIAGWAAGMLLGTYDLFLEHYKASTHAYSLGGFSTGRIYIAVAAVALNLVVVLVGSGVAVAMGAARRQGSIAERDFQPVPRGGERVPVAS